MNSATYQMVIIGLQALLAEAPGLVTSIRDALNKDEITPADWDALRAQVEGDTYEKLVPASKLTEAPVEVQTPASGDVQNPG